jgi:hypothetical protein
MNPKNVADQYEKLLNRFLKHALQQALDGGEHEISQEAIDTVSIYDANISMMPLLAAFAFRNMLSSMVRNKREDLTEDDFDQIVKESMFQFDAYTETQKGVVDGKELRTIH